MKPALNVLIIHAISAWMTKCSSKISDVLNNAHNFIIYLSTKVKRRNVSKDAQLVDILG